MSAAVLPLTEMMSSRLITPTFPDIHLLAAPPDVISVKRTRKGEIRMRLSVAIECGRMIQGVRITSIRNGSESYVQNLQTRCRISREPRSDACT